jgi:proteic killer suppression protein
MILSFGDKTTEDIYNGINSKEARKLPQKIFSVAARKLDMINAAQRLDDLNAPPGNRLERLHGNLDDFYSIRINDQFRIIFKMLQSNVYNVQITDYH